MAASEPTLLGRGGLVDGHRLSLPQDWTPRKFCCGCLSLMRVQYWAVSEGLSVILCEKLICFVEHVVKTMEWLIQARIFVSRHGS